jgi:pyroglutamyl-peptidase I
VTADVLLTGFEPFAGDDVNPSWPAVQRVAATWDGPETLVSAELPVVFGASADALDALIARHRPRLAIAIGLAAGRAAVTPERVAINLDDARISDNGGASPIDRPVLAGGPAAYFSTLPIKAIAAAIEAAGIPAAVSQTAGTFVCNHVFYRLMDAAARRPGMRAGFVHVPLAAEHAGTSDASLPLADIAEAVRLAVRTSLDVPADRRVAGGAIA